MSIRLLRIKDVTEKTGLPRGSVYYMMSRGEFPKNIKIAKRATAWIESDIDSWIEEKIKEAKHE